MSLPDRRFLQLAHIAEWQSDKASPSAQKEKEPVAVPGTPLPVMPTPNSQDAVWEGELGFYAGTTGIRRVWFLARYSHAVAHQPTGPRH